MLVSSFGFLKIYAFLVNFHRMNFINMITDSRLIEDFLLKNSESDFMYILDEDRLNTIADYFISDIPNSPSV
ncbi:hypothetical protein HZS_5488 [Henneguya salminicola]|nr:hypothetical protein HZS_5488 [Henneguya salminicola]